MQISKIVILLALLMAGCGVDKNHPKYDERRYKELQKSRCVDMATVLSSEFITAEPENYDKALKRCEDMKALTFEQYKRLSDHGRQTGVWDVYQVFPEKK
jgi:hypothetical protein